MGYLCHDHAELREDFIPDSDNYVDTTLHAVQGDGGEGSGTFPSPLVILIAGLHQARVLSTCAAATIPRCAARHLKESFETVAPRRPPLS